MLTCLGQGSQTGPGAEIIFHPGHEAGTLPPDTRPRPSPAHHEPPTVPGNCSSMEIKVPGFQTFLIFQRDWGGGKVSDGSGGFQGHWSKSSASQMTHQQQGPGGPCSATCFRKETGRHRTSGGGGRDESGQDARSGQESGRTLPGCRPGEAREGASPGNLEGGGPGTCLECTGPWGPQHCPQGPPFHSRAHLHAAHALPCPAGFRQYGPGPHRPRETNSPPARFRLPGDPSSGSSPSFCRKMTPWQPNLSLYTLQGPQHLSACV